MSDTSSQVFTSILCDALHQIGRGRKQERSSGNRCIPGGNQSRVVSDVHKVVGGPDFDLWLAGKA